MTNKEIKNIYNKAKKLSNKKLWSIFILIIAIGVYIFGYIFPKEYHDVQLLKCMDGDTIKLSIDGIENTIRLLAIDTPETKHPTIKEEYYGKQASDYTCQRITNAKEIKIIIDSNSDEYDKYGRLLGWVLLDDQLLQEDIVKNGYGEIAYIYGEYNIIYMNKLDNALEYAKKNQLGIWSKDISSSNN